MKLFNFLKKKKTKSNIETNVNNQDISTIKSKENKTFMEKLDILFNKKNYDEIVQLVKQRYHDENLPLDVKRILTLTYYHKKEYEESLKYSQEVADELNDVASWFNVLSAFMALNKPNEGKVVFDKILKIHKGTKSTGKGEKCIPQLSIPYIRFYYARMLCDIDLLSDSLLQLELLSDIYSDIKITDSTFLYIRGIPFFEDYLSLLKNIYLKVGLDINQSHIINELLSSVDSEGKEYIKKNILV